MDMWMRDCAKVITLGAMVIGALLAGAFGLGSQAAQPEMPLLPDLVPLELEVLPSNANPGDAARLRATIANRGSANAESFAVRFLVNGRIQGSKFVPGLSAGEETHIETLWVIPSGQHTLKVEADAFDQIEESNEINNSLTLQLEFGVDLTISDVTLTPPHPKPGEMVRFTVEVLNRGARGTPQSFAVQFFIGRRLIYTGFIRGLEGGEAQELEGAWLAEEGEHVIRLVADPFEAISETDEANNVFTRVIDISPFDPTGADLVVSKLELDPPNPEFGQGVTVRTTIVNSGRGAALGFEVSFQIDGQLIATRSVAGLGVAEKVELEVSWTAEGGERLIRVKADSQGLISELDEENNIAVLVAYLGPPLNRCGQFALLEFRSEAFPILIALTGLSTEEVEHVFLPQIKRVMEEQYEGVNIRFTFLRPSEGRYATVAFDGEDRGNVLGRAPLGFRFGVARVFLGSFARHRSLFSYSLRRLAIIFATVASHELGHLLGLGHTSQNDAKDIMSANAELAPLTTELIPQFTAQALAHLQRLLPLECS